MLSYRTLQFDAFSLERYAVLFKQCFPGAHHFTMEYLQWLYVENPAGKAVGMDAVSGGQLAAHYACIPAKVALNGASVNALLSLNTATHPDFRGQGLFTNLARLTFKAAESGGFSAVYGVANANSTPGFVRKLGFQLVRKLDARLGFGRQLSIDWERSLRVSQFRREWDLPQLSWRTRNPYNPVVVRASADGITELYAKTDKKFIYAWGEVPISTPPHENSSAPVNLCPRLFLGISPSDTVRNKFSISIPDKLRPSPLNFIFRPLDREIAIDRNRVSFSFIDFDAY